MNPRCEQLDAFLGGWLTEAEANAFARHQDQCPKCDAAVKLSREIDDALRTAAAAVVPPTTVVPAARRRLAWRRFYVRAAIAASVVMVAGGVVWQLASRDTRVDDVPPERIAVQTESPPTPAPVAGTTASPVRATFDQSVIPVSYESQNPNVTLIFVYPRSGQGGGDQFE